MKLGKWSVSSVSKIVLKSMLRHQQMLVCWHIDIRLTTVLLSWWLVLNSDIYY